jgi:hypothetical protein
MGWLAPRATLDHANVKPCAIQAVRYPFQFQFHVGEPSSKNVATMRDRFMPCAGVLERFYRSRPEVMG